MLSIEELKKLITDIESDRIERTISTKDTDKLGYVNKYGRGIIRAKDALEKNGNP